MEKFRPDINGLRAVAVVLVMLFHFEAQGFGGGFVGVDVFFVISGYLMTKIIVHGLRSGTFSVTSFYLARAKRIVPALAVMSAFVLALGYFYVIPTEYRELAKHAIVSLGFLSNFQYWREAGYFAAVAHQKWLLHTWSLSVEWQFYLLYPVLLQTLHRALPLGRVRFALAAIALLSLMVSIGWSAVSPEASFFLLHTRAWELLFGGLVFYFPPRIRSAWAVESGGLALIIAGSMLFVPADAWPGWKALVPTLGAAMVISAGRGGDTILRAAPAQWLGRVSYSLYLWHWPVVVWLAQTDRIFDLRWRLAGAVVSLLAAGASFQVIEKSWLRRSAARVSFQFAAIVALMGIAGLAAVGVFVQGGLPGRMPQNYLRVASEIQMPTRRNGWCFYSVDTMPELEVGEGGVSCAIGARNGNLQALLFGDSFAGQNEPFWDEVGKQAGVRIAAVSTNWCSPSLGQEFIGPLTRKRSYSQCLFNRQFLRESLPKYPVVIFAGRWDRVFSKGQQQGLFDAIAFAAKSARLVVVMAAPTTYDVNISIRWAMTVLRHENFNAKIYHRNSDIKTADANTQIGRFTATLPNVLFLDRDILFHGAEVTAENIPFGLDEAHLSIYGAKASAHVFEQSVQYQRLMDVLRVPSIRPDL